jgi:hypothetical protein
MIGSVPRKPYRRANPATSVWKIATAGTPSRAAAVAPDGSARTTEYST